MAAKYIPKYISHDAFGMFPSATVGLPVKFGIAVFKASILNSLGGPLAKVGLSAKFGVVVFKASILYSVGGPSAKITFNNNITYSTWQI